MGQDRLAGLYSNIDKMKQPTSSQARKQRKWRANAPLHKRRKMVCSPLSMELKKKYNRNAVAVRKGDTVRVTRGSERGHKGEVMDVDLSKYRIYINGMISKKTDGKEVERPIDASNVVIVELYDEDRKRMDALMNKKEVE